MNFNQDPRKKPMLRAVLAALLVPLALAVGFVLFQDFTLSLLLALSIAGVTQIGGKPPR